MDEFRKKDFENEPSEFNNLSNPQQEILLDWISQNLSPIKSFNSKHTSYGLKHLFEDSKKGFYIYNGAFKGAMLKLGFEPQNEKDVNWYFNISEKSPAFKNISH